MEHQLCLDPKFHSSSSPTNTQRKSDRLDTWKGVVIKKKLTPFRSKAFNITGHAICYRQSSKTEFCKMR